MKLKSLIAFLVGLAFASSAMAQSNELRMTPTDIILGSALETAGATYTAALSAASYLTLDILNDTDCDVEVRLDDVTGAPTSVVLAGTFETLNPGAARGFFKTAVSARKVTGDTCASGSLYIKGIK